MYKQKIKATKSTIISNDSYEGETIEQKVRRITNNKEPIEDGAPIIFTERKDGVKPEYDIRTDRFDLALDAMDKVTASKLAEREARHNPTPEPKKETPTGESGKPASSEATSPGSE